MHRQDKAINTDLVSSGSVHAAWRWPFISISWWPVLPPAAIAFISQLVAAASLLVLLFMSGLMGLSISILPVSLLHGAIAAFVGSRFGLASWWLPINLLFMPVVVLTSFLNVAPSWFLAAFMLLLFLYWSVFRSQVPLYHSSRKAWIAVAGLIPDKPGFFFLDVGAGLGGMLGYLSQKRTDGKFCGMEIAPLPFVLAWLRKKLGRSEYQIEWGDFWAHNFAAYDVVYAYLSPVPMARIWAKACMEMEPGNYFISNSFPVADAEPEKVLDLDDLHNSRLYVYRIPAKRLAEPAP